MRFPPKQYPIPKIKLIVYALSKRQDDAWGPINGVNQILAIDMDLYSWQNYITPKWLVTEEQRNKAIEAMKKHCREFGYTDFSEWMFKVELIEVFDMKKSYV